MTLAAAVEMDMWNKLWFVTDNLNFCWFGGCSQDPVRRVVFKKIMILFKKNENERSDWCTQLTQNTAFGLEQSPHGARKQQEKVLRSHRVWCARCIIYARSSGKKPATTFIIVLWLLIVLAVLDTPPFLVILRSPRGSPRGHHFRDALSWRIFWVWQGQAGALCSLAVGTAPLNMARIMLDNSSVVYSSTRPIQHQQSAVHSEEGSNEPRGGGWRPWTDASLEMEKICGTCPGASLSLRRRPRRTAPPACPCSLPLILSFSLSNPLLDGTEHEHSCSRLKCFDG
jgi:hypothetical protein